MRPFGRLVPVATAMRRLFSAAHPLTATEEVPLENGVGRVAAETWRAPRPVPDFRRATWDGFAIRSRDTRSASAGRPVSLRLVGEVYAEGALDRPLRPGEAAAIATGGAVPRGADAVLIFEETETVDGQVLVRRFVPPDERIAAPGDDFPRGTRIVRVGDFLDPAAIGALAATGRAAVRVYRKPRVALLSNGNELVPPGRALKPGQIHEVNNLTLGALITAAGGVPHALPPLPDVPTRIEAALRRALRSHDVVVVTGGSSVGEHDYLPTIFPRIGTLLFHGVAVRPGKPTLAAHRGTKLLLGMPGHPTSCLSNGMWMLLPLLRRVAGLPGPGWVEIPVRLGKAWGPASPTMTTVVPLHVENGVARPTFKDSSAISSLRGANAYALRPPGSPHLPAGATQVVRLLPSTLGVPAVH
ncbi:MAG TPA: molybdopterin molybdotransferase MoeA [Thermoplasmata archaeon]|nr:molybdopterin molybdotransferase MoeA [Thermoplasmata archaeon]